MAVKRRTKRVVKRYNKFLGAKSRLGPVVRKTYEKYKANPETTWLFNRKTGVWRRIVGISTAVTESEIGVTFLHEGRRLTEWFNRVEWGLRSELPAAAQEHAKHGEPVFKPEPVKAPAPPPPPAPAPVSEDDLTPEEEAALSNAPAVVVENPGNIKAEQKDEYIARLHVGDSLEMLQDPMKVREMRIEAEKNFAIQEGKFKLEQARHRAMFGKVAMMGTGAIPDAGAE